MARYKALAKIPLPSGMVEVDEEFTSDLVPGTNWKPLDKEARDAVKARAFVKAPGSSAPQPDLATKAELDATKAALAEALAQVEALTAPPVNDPPAA
jgi:hypothetical protein